MGQAAVELPEPTEPTPAPSTGSADDLLSQLAGDEIDRLLAEAETADKQGAGKVPLVVPSLAKSSATPVAGAPERASTVEPPPPAEPAKVEAPAAITEPPPVAAQPAAPAAEVQDQLDALFNELTGVGAMADAVESVAPSPATNQDQIDAIVTQANELITTDASPMAVSTTASLEAELVQSLDATVKPAAVSAPALEAKQAPATSNGDAWYVRLLEILNAPFTNLPEATRELIGKIAIVTVFNAAVILVYVFVFRG